MKAELIALIGVFYFLSVVACFLLWIGWNVWRGRMAIVSAHSDMNQIEKGSLWYGLALVSLKPLFRPTESETEYFYSFFSSIFSELGFAFLIFGLFAFLKKYNPDKNP